MLSSFPMIATSCGVKKKDVETSNSEKSRIQNPTQNLNAGNQDSKKQTQNLNQKKKIQNPTQNLNAENQDSRKSNLKNLNAGKQDSETNVSSNELTRPGEKHTKWYANRKIWNKRLFR
nr:hypothetical protein [Mycoplasmopsis bovis]